MHELSVTQSILEIALTHANQNHAARICSINLVVGQLATIVDDCVQFYWDIISDGTIASGAVLHFQRIPAQMQCQICDRCYVLDDSDLICPQCGSSDVRLVDGAEFYVESIEVDQ